MPGGVQTIGTTGLQNAGMLAEVSQIWERRLLCEFLCAPETPGNARAHRKMSSLTPGIGYSITSSLTSGIGHRWRTAFKFPMLFQQHQPVGPRLPPGSRCPECSRIVKSENFGRHRISVRAYSHTRMVRYSRAGINEEDSKGMGKISGSEQTRSVRASFPSASANSRRQVRPGWLYSFGSWQRKGLARHAKAVPQISATFPIND